MKKEMAALLFYFYIESFSFSVSLSLLLLSSLHYMPMIYIAKIQKSIFHVLFQSLHACNSRNIAYIYINILLEFLFLTHFI